MSIVQKQNARDPKAGYARDFVSLMREILPDCVGNEIKVLSNAGGVNVTGRADAIRETARETGLIGQLRLGVVTGDDILDRLDDVRADAVVIGTMDTGESLSAVRDNVQTPKLYLVAAPLVE